MTHTLTAARHTVTGIAGLAAVVGCMVQTTNNNEHGVWTMNTHKLYRAIASTMNAMENCRKNGNNEWLDRHEDSLQCLMGFMPSGSGIDNGTTLDRDASTDDKLVFTFGYHHMNEGGMYDGWTEHALTVKPSLMFGIDLRITGRNRNDIKDYLHDTYRECLMADVWQTSDGKWHSSQYETVTA